MIEKDQIWIQKNRSPERQVKVVYSSAVGSLVNYGRGWTCYRDERTGKFKRVATPAFTKRFRPVPNKEEN